MRASRQDDGTASQAVVGRIQRPGRARLLDLFRQRGHVRELGVGTVPRPGLPRPRRLPAVVNDDVRAVRACRSERHDPVSHFPRGRRRVVAVGVVPVVVPVDGVGQQARLRTHLTAEGVQRRERRFPRLAGPRDDGADVQHTRPQTDADPAAAHIRPQADAFRVGLPETERAGAGQNPVPVGARAVPGGEIPGQDVFGDQALPGQFAIRALPGVAKNQTAGVHPPVPAQVQALHGGFGRGQRHRQPIRLRDGGDLDVRPRPPPAGGVGECLIAGFREDPDDVRGPVQIEETIHGGFLCGFPGGLRGRVGVREQRRPGHGRRLADKLTARDWLHCVAP